MTEQFKDWWKSLSEREQQLTAATAAFLLLAILYWGAWKPLSNQLQKSEMALNNAQQTLGWVQEKAAILVQGGVAKEPILNKKSSLTQLVTKSARDHGIHFSRIVNKREEIEVWIADVEFDLFIEWLSDLNNRYSVSVLNTDFSRMDNEGHIKINRLLLGY